MKWWFWLRLDGWMDGMEEEREWQFCPRSTHWMKLPQQSPHVSEAAGSANPKPWGFNSDWSRGWSYGCWKCTPPVNVSISLKLTLALTWWWWSGGAPLVSVRPRKSRVRRSVLCHLASSPDVNPPPPPIMYSVEIWLTCWWSICCRLMWPTDCPCWQAAAAPTVAALWRRAVADRCADVAVFDDVGWKNVVCSTGDDDIWWCATAAAWKWWWWASAFTWTTGLGLGFWGGSHGVRGICVGKCWVVGFEKGKRGWFAESLALSSANASQNALWVMKLSFLHVVFHANITHKFTTMHIYLYICYHQQLTNSEKKQWRKWVFIIMMNN